MSTLFWDDAKVDPKRRFRYELVIGTTPQSQIQSYYIKTANMPKANVSTIEHSYLDYNLKFPGRVTWDPISVTLVAPSSGADDPTDILMLMLKEAGYIELNEAGGGNRKRQRSMSKASFQQFFGAGPKIRLIDHMGNAVEEWTLHNAFITQADFGGSLDYTSDEMLELTIELTFDFATLENKSAPAAQALGAAIG
jgi:hypothetical protein|tara:strand:- start:3061 stop:3645 length:585 start_codon:yes stop_codon:yes gene_type:complete